MNQIKFCQEMYMLASEDIDISKKAIRNRNTALLFSLGAFHETFNLLNEMETNFGDFPDFTKKLRKFLNKSGTQETLNYLKLIRDKIIFHIDKEPIKKILQILDENQYLFFVNESDVDGEIYYELADMVGMFSIMYEHIDKSNTNLDELKEKYSIEHFGNLLSKIANCFNIIQICDELIIEYANQVGLQLKNNN